LALDAQELKKLRRIVALAEKLISESRRLKRGRPALSAKQVSGEKRLRRTGKELMAFRRILKLERKKGVPVAEIARKHKISAAYIYLLP
jgi:hypothetical protein